MTAGYAPVPVKTEIFANRAAFDARPDVTVNGVTQAFADSHPGWDAERGSKGCWKCVDCRACTGCTGCTLCTDCTDCTSCAACVNCTHCVYCASYTGHADLVDGKNITVAWLVAHDRTLDNHDPMSHTLPHDRRTGRP